ncbi:MAG: hypothetical protein NT000_04640 [Proteobacteria bacterium]|nr:hypothetical protein [Pseudomonadota bacterium]
MAKVIREKKMAVSQEALFKTITEFEKYPDFLKEVVGAKVVGKRTPEKIRVQFEIEIVRKFIYILEFSIVSKNEITWKLIESDFFKQNEGRWILNSNGTHETAVHYELEVGVVFLIPSWISNKFLIALNRERENSLRPKQEIKETVWQMNQNQI